MSDDAMLAAHFESMFTAEDDPWRYRTRWYEARKRAVLLAALPAEHYAQAYEPGCAGGELTAALATRCERLLATDGSHAAIVQARRRTAAHPHVRCEQSATPAQWPRGAFDLIVVSELGYYLDENALDQLVERSVGSLAPGGTLLACHWRHPEADFRCSGDAVQARFARLGGLPCLLHHEEEDFALDVWSRDERSVARREGLA